MARKALPVSKLRARRRKRRAIVSLSALGLLLLLCAIGIGISWLPWLRIGEVEARGATSVKQDQVREVVENELQGARWYIFAKDNIFLYPKVDIERKLMEEFPTFERVTVSKDNVWTLLVEITERTSQALWCGESPATSSACYLLDSSGVAYAPAANFGSDVYIKYFGSVAPGAKKQFLEPTQFNVLSATAHALKAQVQGLRLISISVLNNEVRADFEGGFAILFLVSDSGADVLERIALALQSEPFAKRSLTDFAYLDLRFGDKLYYKLK